MRSPHEILDERRRKIRANRQDNVSALRRKPARRLEDSDNSIDSNRRAVYSLAAAALVGSALALAAFELITSGEEEVGTEVDLIKSKLEANGL